METTRASLLIRIRDGKNAAAWGEFDRLYRPMLTRFALARGLDANAAEDVVQHAMMAVQSHIKDLNYDPDRGRFRGWLRTIVNNRIRNLLAARHERLAETRDFNRADPAASEADDAFDLMWMKEHLNYCLNQLRESVELTSYRAFELFVLQDKPVEAVCTELSLNANQLYSIKFRLTRKLAELMREVVGEPEL